MGLSGVYLSKKKNAKKSYNCLPRLYLRDGVFVIG